MHTLLSKKARDHFQNKEYSNALSCYLELSSKIGGKYFEINIKKCLSELDKNYIKRPTERVLQLQLQIHASKAIGSIDESLHYLKKLIEESKTNSSQSAITITTKERSHDLYAIEILNNLPTHPTQPVKTKEKNKVLYILHHSLPYISNGYATRAHGMAGGMRDSGLNVICITRPGFPLDYSKAEISFQSHNEIEGIIYKHTDTPRRSGPERSKNYFLEAAQEIIKIIKIEKPAAIIVASNYVNAIPAIIAAKTTGVPIAYEVRGFWEITEESKNPAFANSYEYLLKKKLEILSTQKVNKIFTLGYAMKDELTRRGANKDIISIIPNACDSNQFKPSAKDSTLRSTLQITEDTTIIGYIGSFVQYEGLDILTEACARLKNKNIKFKLILIGASNGDVFEKIKQIIAREKLEEHVILPGRIQHNEVQKWYSIIDIAPFPRKSQPVTELVTPLKPMEAMSMEKAVIVSSVAAMAEMVIDNETGLIFEKDNSESLSNALETLIAQRGLRRNLGHNARNWITKERTWKKMGETVKNWIDFQS